MITSVITIRDSDASFRWEIGLVLLSLDRVTPFWEEIELEFSNPENVREAIRSTVIQQQHWDAGEDPEYLNKLSTSINNLLADLQHIEGDNGPLTLRLWMEEVLIASDHEPPWHSAWHSLLTMLDESQEAVLEKLGMPREKIPKLVELADEWSQAQNEIEDRIEEVEAQPLEVWDEEQYRYYQRESTDVSPLDWLSACLRHIKFKGLWNEMLALLDPEEITVLNQWGQVTCAVRTSIPSQWAEIQAKDRIR